MFKFLPGIILIQLVTSGLVLTAFNWAHDPQLIAVIVLFAIIIAVLCSFWFAAIAHDIHKHEQTHMLEQHAQDREKILLAAEREKAYIAAEKSNMSEQHARERERILVNAEREKANIASESYRHIEKETKKAHAKANFKVGAAFASAVGAGGIMIFSQFVTVGMMVLLASGSGLVGYLARARHERLSRNKQLAENNALLNGGQPVITSPARRLQKN